MEIHINLVGSKNLSRDVYRQIRRGIADGRLRPGDVLPPSRHLARRLEVSRMTVTVAYDRLRSEGLVTSRVGAGTFVSKHAVRPGAAPARARTSGVLRPRSVWDSIAVPKFAQPAAFDFRGGLTDPSLFPHRTWRRLVGRSLRGNDATAAVYQDPAGHPDLRAAIARHIGISRGVEASAEDITITNGTQQALDILGRVLLAPGDRIAVEDPGYPPQHRLFGALDIQLIGVPVDRDGLVVDALPQRTRVVYVTPSHQFPLGVSMSLERRQAVLAWAERNNAAIIEDDYDNEFRFGGRPLEPLCTLDTTGRVIYVGSFSKTMLPTLRLGFIVTPPSLRAAVHKAKFVADRHSPMLAQSALAQFIDDGSFARHVRKASNVYRARHDRIADRLRQDFADHLELMPSSAGLHLAAIARRASADEIAAVVRRAATAGVAIQTLAFFALGEPKPAGVVLGYGVVAIDDIDEGLRRLRACF